jgi:TRAP-type mannitol/chloroaromatic compound transport system permease large subunit
VLFALSTVAAILFDRFYYVPAYPEAMLDERLVLAAAAGAGFALACAALNRMMKLGWLSRLAEQVIFVLIPPLGLIFLVLGTIFLGWATPTEGGAMGAAGALVMAMARRRLSFKLVRQAMDTTAKLVVLRGLHPHRRRASSASRSTASKATSGSRSCWWDCPAGSSASSSS